MAPIFLLIVCLFLPCALSFQLRISTESSVSPANLALRKRLQGNTVVNVIVSSSYRSTLLKYSTYRHSFGRQSKLNSAVQVQNTEDKGDIGVDIDTLLETMQLVASFELDGTPATGADVANDGADRDTNNSAKALDAIISSLALLPLAM